MADLAAFWAGADGVTRAVALLLLAMSVTGWSLILWKGWLLRRVQRDLARAVPAFWASADVAGGRDQLRAFDREGALLTLLDAAIQGERAGTLEASGAPGSQLTRRLRDALHAALRPLQSGQVLLASIGATAPFVGLFGTVWGIYHALVGLASAGTLGIERIAGPVGEALVMTAAGLGVAIPAVLAYNVFGSLLAASETELEGFAFDLREMLQGQGVAPHDPRGD